jgi:hypothetical protein
MPINDADYPSGQPTPDTKLAAMGFDPSGHRGGGIDNPQVQILPMNTIMLRLYKPKFQATDNPGDFGEWWFTPFEYHRICDYFGVDGRALIVDRSKGKSALHGVLALLSEWYKGSPEQLSYLNAVRLKEPIVACYGSGAPGNADDYARTLRPIKISGGKSARQVFIYQCWKYSGSLERLLPPNTSTDAVFGAPNGLPSILANAPRISFET